MTERDRDEPLFLEAMREQFVARELPSGRHRRQRPRARRPAARRLIRPLPLAGAGMALAAAVAALVIALGAGGSEPATAYAVTVDQNTITIRWSQWRDIGALNARLTMMGMRIRVVPVVHGCVAPVHHVIYAQNGVPTHIAPGPASTLEVGHAGRFGEPGAMLTTWNNTLPGRTRIFTATRSSGWTGAVFTVVGPAPRCVGDGG